jgi:hypothetical protein
MKTIAGLIFSVILILTSVPAIAQECYKRDAFFEAVKHPDTVIMIANADATKKLVAKLNENRAKNGMHPIDGRSLAIGILKDRAGVTKVGVAIFDAQDCVIRETVILLPMEHWVAFANEAGVSAEDFAKLQDS